MSAPGDHNLTHLATTGGVAAAVLSAVTVRAGRANAYAAAFVGILICEFSDMPEWPLAAA